LDSKSIGFEEETLEDRVAHVSLGRNATHARRKKMGREVNDLFSLPHQNGNPAPPGCRFGFLFLPEGILARFSR
jgi:hypothetical protein